MEGTGLVRRSLNRPATNWVFEFSAYEILDLFSDQLAPEVTALQFEYFDGFQWLPDWDTELYEGLPTAVRIIVAIAPSDFESGGRAKRAKLWCDRVRSDRPKSYGGRGPYLSHRRSHSDREATGRDSDRYGRCTLMARSIFLPAREWHTGRSTTRRSGVALVIVLVVVMVLSLVAYSFSDLMLTERAATDLTVQQSQARLLVESGVEATRVLLSRTPDERLVLGGIHDNPQRFQGALVLDDPQAAFRGRVTMVSRGVGPDGYYQGVRYGLENESGRINLNAILLADVDQGKELLTALPGMTVEVVDALLDWIDEDSEPREFGVEDYSGFFPGYSPRNGPIETLDELLLVRGVTPELLYGLDRNRNGMLDADEGGELYLENADNSRGLLDLGLASYLTLHSVERNLDALGEARINLNTEDMQELHDLLSEVMDPDWATFIVAYKQNGPYEPNQGGDNEEGQGPGGDGDSPGGSDVDDGESPSGDGDQSAPGRQSAGGGPGQGEEEDEEESGEEERPEGEAVDGRQVDLEQPGGTKIKSILDLIGVQVQVRFQDADEDDDPTIVDSPFSDDPAEMASYLPQIMDVVTTSDAETLPGRINVNVAPLAVLEAIPGMPAEAPMTILGQRNPNPDAVDESRNHEYWLLAEGLVTLDEMKELEPYITTRGEIFRTQVIGFFDGDGPMTRVEVLIDASTDVPRVISWKDMSNLGRAFDTAMLGTEPDSR